MIKLIRTTVLFLLVQKGMAAVAIPIHDNGNSELVLSKTNYNRLYVKHDEIWQVAFPKHTLAVQKDEQDPSLYVLAQTDTPFTLFVTTKAGHHFSLTVNSEASLGKTIELVLPQEKSAEVKLPVSASAPVLEEQAIDHFLVQLQSHQLPQGVKVKRPFGQARHYGQITLIPDEIWETTRFKGEIITVYNAAKKPLLLSPDWFKAANTKAIHLSRLRLAPREKTRLYRVSEHAHA